MADVELDAPGLDLDAFRSLESNDFQVELRPVPGRKRPHEDVEVVEVDQPDPVDSVDVTFEQPDASDEEDVRVVLCEGGPKSGGMSYYLSRNWERQDGEPEENGENGLALVSPEEPEPDEASDKTISKVSFHMDEAELADAPWRGPMSNQSDFFNFNLTEDEFKETVRRSIRLRFEARRRRKEGRDRTST